MRRLDHRQFGGHNLPRVRCKSKRDVELRRVHQGVAKATE
ncbi:unnamed protein product [Linum tenue]|uniref:Uncharacterized protein n=1 Tax=Linum tenue TaxID=586396 RepID=A0AAV0HU40_9ROSI|nr:unnamed protein product [Linum tenue]